MFKDTMKKLIYIREYTKKSDLLLLVKTLIKNEQLVQLI